MNVSQCGMIVLAGLGADKMACGGIEGSSEGFELSRLHDGRSVGGKEYA